MMTIPEHEPASQPADVEAEAVEQAPKEAEHAAEAVEQTAKKTEQVAEDAEAADWRARRDTRRRQHLRTNVLILVVLLAGTLFLWLWADHLTARAPELPTVLLVPLDSRPVNTDLPQQLAAIAGIRVTLPEQELLDMFLTPSRPDRLFDWLGVHMEYDYDLTVIHVNELLFGGLLNSREYSQYQDADYKLDSLFAYLRQRKNTTDGKLVLVYIVPRLLPSQYDDDMWAYEKELPELSQLKHRLSLEPGDTRLPVQISELEASIPREIVLRYETVFAEAHRTGLSMMEWLNQGLADEVIIGLDDSAEFGLNVKVYHDLKDHAIQRGHHNARFLHGADEIAPLIIARHALDYVGGEDAFSLHYLSEGHEHVILPFESMPLIENFNEKADYLQGVRASAVSSTVRNAVTGAATGAATSARASRAMSAVSGSAYKTRPKYIYVFADREASAEQIQEAWRTIRSDRARPADAMVGVVDVARVNGAWTPFIESVGPDRVHDRVDAYAGWNTAGNSLGTVMAHLMFWEAAQQLAGQEKREAVDRHENFQKLRLIDDYFFQSKVRSELIEWTTREGFHFLSFGGRWMEANDKLQEMMEEALAPWPGMAPALGGADMRQDYPYRFRFPWARSFEIHIEVR